MERHRESDADDRAGGQSTRPRGHSVAERATEKGGEQVEIRTKGCGINREINGGEWGLEEGMGRWEHRYLHSGKEVKRTEALAGREVRHLLSTVILTLVCRLRQLSRQ